MSEVETRYGRLTVLKVDSDVIGRFLARYGEWAWCEASFVASVLHDDARVLDVGAFAGTFGLGVALSRPLGFLCFVEANPVVAQLLEGNVVGKTQCPVVVVEALVAGPDARARVGRSEPDNLGSTSFCLDGGAEDAVPALVRVVTLADLRAEHGAFDLIKLDVEGMELEVLHGDADHLAKGQTTLWIECNEDRRSLDVARLLLSWNLKLFYYAFPSYNSDNFNGDPEAVFPLAFEAGLLVAPKTCPSLTIDLQAKGCILKALHSVEDLKDALWRTPRWGMPEWEAATSKHELAALVGRLLRSELFDDFLEVDGPTAPDKVMTIWKRLEATEAGLRDARVLLDEERGRRGQLEDELQVAEKLAIERLHQLDAEWQQRDRLEDRLRKAEVLAAEQQALASSLEVELARACARALAYLSALGVARDRTSILENELLAEHAAAQTELLAERAAAQTELLTEHAAAQAELLAERAAAQTELLTERAAAQAELLKLLETLEARVWAEERRAEIAEHTVDMIRTSTLWRVSAPVRAFVSTKPLLRAAARKSRAVAGSIVRRWRR